MPHTADRLVALALRDGPAEWPVVGDADEFAKVFIERAGYHGVIGLLNAAQDSVALWPSSVRSELRDRAFASAAWELRHRSYLQDVTTRLAEKQINAVILKGTALAYDLYAEPAHRTRSDTDLLVEKHHIDAVRRELSQLGFIRTASAEGPFGEIHLQEGWARRCPSGFEHLIDLHWQAMNASALEGVLTFADCLDDPI
ncbi:MAG: nucleotidyltransferase family protein, partial [Novosphingobium sp.]